MNTKEFIELAQKYVAGKCTWEEKKKVETFFEKSQQQQIALGDESKIYQNILNKIYLRIQQQQIIKKRRKRKTIIGVSSMFLIITVFLFIWDSFDHNLQVVSTKYGEQKEVVLPDGSVVMLNVGSTIRFPENFSSDTRDVKLKGEAFFKVTHDKNHPFRVKTESLITTVLGTSFNIKSYEDEHTIQVAVKTGKVKVTDKNENVLALLTKNHMISYNQESHLYRSDTLNIDKYIVWKEKLLVLDNITFEKSIKTLEKWFDITIEVNNPSLLNRKVTGTYKKPELTNVLESLSFLTGCTYKIENNRTIIIN